MGMSFNKITKDAMEFIQRQKMFFVGTAPTSEGEVHIAAKGYDTLRIIDANKILYLDYFGSENDTARHLSENGKISLMWCSFDEKPRVLRAYGRGRIISKEADEFPAFLSEYFKAFDKRLVRQIFEISVHKTLISCGYGIPLMTYEKDREKLHEYFEKRFVKSPARKIFSAVIDRAYKNEPK
jgi:hypothetical protein